MKTSTVAIIAALAVAVSGPALAQNSQKRVSRVDRFEQCESKANALGMPHGQAGHAEYVRECMGGRPGNTNAIGAGSRPPR
jgi:hypothetical protein